MSALADQQAVVLEARGLVREYRLPRTSLRRAAPVVPALRGVDLRVARGERFGIVGESGSGKSTLARLLLALDRPQAGEVLFDGVPVTGRGERELRSLRRQAQIVFQDPMSSLDPRMRVRDLIVEPLRALRLPGDHRARLAELLDAVGLEPEAAARYPHQFSGGQRQRIAIARALAPAPSVLVADEPVSALDVSVRAQILNLLRDLTDRLRLTLVFVSHDLSVVRFLCERVAVMYQGRVVELGATEDVYGAPQHPYTRSLLASVPTLDGRLVDDEPADEPNPGVPADASCAFAWRCPLVHHRCLVERPQLRGRGGKAQHEAACHLAFTGKVDER